MNSLAAAAFVKDLCLAVGIWYLFMKALAHSLLASISAPALVGPKHLMPWEVSASTIPSARGSSGPMITSSMVWSLHHFATACIKLEINFYVSSVVILSIYVDRYSILYYVQKTNSIKTLSKRQFKKLITLSTYLTCFHLEKLWETKGIHNLFKYFCHKHRLVVWSNKLLYDWNL